MEHVPASVLLCERCRRTSRRQMRSRGSNPVAREAAVQRTVQRVARGCAAGLALCSALGACTARSYRAGFSRDPAALDTHSQFLKCHLFDGGVVVLERWRFDRSLQLVSGNGPS